MKGAHESVAAEHEPAAQLPARVRVAVPAGHTAEEHIVPAAYFWQAPLPSHRPFVPHESACASLQTPCASGSPAATFEHVPFLPATAQETQAPVQAESQHTPSTQLPNAHWVGFVASHASPLAFFATHMPPTPVQ